MAAALTTQDGYITGGFSAWLWGDPGFLVTPPDPARDASSAAATNLAG